jgi:hypothetical protein
MMCGDARRICVELAGESLPAEVDRHLLECAACRKAYQQTLSIQKMIGLKRHERPAAGFEDRLVASVVRAIRQPEPRPGFLAWLAENFLPGSAPAVRWAAAAACAAMLVGAGFLIMQPPLENGPGLAVQSPVEDDRAFLDQALIAGASITSPAPEPVSTPIPVLAATPTQSWPNSVSPGGIQYGPGPSVPVQYQP